MKPFLVFLSILGLSGCVAVPDEIAVAPDANLIGYETINKSTDSPTQAGEIARWGGEIVKVDNKPEFSEIEIVVYPENSMGKPQANGQSPGRFKAIVPGFVDPLVLEPGRLITVLGNVGRNVKGQIGEQVYQYPTIDTQGYYIWQKTEEYEVESYMLTSGLYGPRFAYRGFVHPWHDPFWGFHARKRVKVKHSNKRAHGDNPEPPSRPAQPNDTGGPLISEPKTEPNNRYIRER